MRQPPKRFRITKVAAGSALSAAILVWAASPAFASPPSGTNLLQNPTFAPPDQAANTNPPNWNLDFLGAESNPYNASINSYDASGQYKPPAGDPDANGIGDEVFYEAGSATGIEGIGAEQDSSSFGSITQADDPQVSYSAVPTSTPTATTASWAGSAFEVDFTSGAQTYSLIYFNPWPAYKPSTYGSFTGTPINSATVKYIIGPALTSRIWFTQSPRDLSADILANFGLSTYTVNDVIAADLENTINSDAGGQYPDMTGFFADVSLAEGSPNAALPESPSAIALPLVALGVMGVGGLVLRRRRKAAPAS